MDFSRLNRGEIIAGIGGALLVLALFLKWYGYPIGGAPISIAPSDLGAGTAAPGTAAAKTVTVDGWDSFSFIDFVLLVTGLSGVLLAGLAAFGRRLKTPFSRGALASVFGSIATLVVVWKICDPVFGGSLKIGIFAALIGAAGVAVGGYLTSLDDGDDLWPVTSGAARKPAARKKPAARRASR